MTIPSLSIEEGNKFVNLIGFKYLLIHNQNYYLKRLYCLVGFIIDWSDKGWSEQIKSYKRWWEVSVFSTLISIVRVSS
jgi:hypothetical protein